MAVADRCKSSLIPSFSWSYGDDEWISVQILISVTQSASFLALAGTRKLMNYKWTVMIAADPPRGEHLHYIMARRVV